MGEDTSQIRREIEQTRARIGDTVGAIGYKADVPSRVRDNVTERIATVRETVDQTKQKISERVRDAGDASALTLQNPLGLAFGGLALGFLAGLLVPISDLERERIGPVREELAKRAQSAVSDAAEAGKAVLNETLATAGQSLQQHGSEVVRHAAAGDGEGAKPAD